MLKGVGAIMDRPWILQSKIHRRKAKSGLFTFGKSEKLRFSAGDQ
jgi:hypothetical protein